LANLMRTFWAQPLRRQLLVANLLIAVPVVGLAVWEGVAAYRDQHADLQQRTDALAVTTAVYIDRDVRSFERIGRRLRTLPAIERMDPVAVQPFLEQIIAERAGLLDVVLVDASGRDVARADADAPVLDDRQWVSRGPPVVEVVGGYSPARFVVFGYPFEASDGSLLGALGFYLNLEWLHQAFSFGELSDNSVVRVTRKGGPWPAMGAAGAPVSPGVHTGSDGVSRHYAMASFGDGAWLVTVGVPTDLVSGAIWDAWMRNAGVAGLVLVACFLAAWFVASRVHASVSDLEAMARRIAAGDFGPIDRRPTFSPEFAQLQTAFDAMLQRFNATRAALDAQMGEERRIRKELESLQTQVIQQERLAAVGQLVSGVAHEINNPLQAILGFAELLQMQSDVPENVKSDLRLIQKESTRACNIIRNLAMFARQQPGEAGPVVMSDVIRAVAELRQRRLETEDIELVVDDRATQPVTAVLTELQQVLLNFVVNAEQAMLGANRLPGRITIRSFERDGRVVLEVEDTGPGVPLASEAKLFQPFFTTKPVGQGTGLGLSISYGIIESLGGAIGHRRVPKGGAIFYIELPTAPATSPATTPDRLTSAGPS
jgi:signal transduction histidine kinase